MPYRRIVKWLPWKYIIKRVARAQGFVDPISVLSKVHGFAQPSEIQEPMELLRAGVVFHARGLINTKAIQHNLDWVWPFWVERQFDPLDEAFIPRAFSITHVNLTHRNWTAVGLPDCDLYPIVDPHGLVTPVWDSWSIDGWILSEHHGDLLPSRALAAQQQLELEGNLVVRTQLESAVGKLATSVWLDGATPVPSCICEYTAVGSHDGWLAVAIRPYNPEGVSFIYDIAIDSSRQRLLVDDTPVELSEPADGFSLSEYHHGDVYNVLKRSSALGSASNRTISCRIGMATAAALYQLRAGEERRVLVRVPLEHSNEEESATRPKGAARRPGIWEEAVAGCPEIEAPDARLCFLFDAAVRTIILHSPHDVYPGPYTYKRFWFRDAAFIAHALLACGKLPTVKRVLNTFPGRQTRAGYFLSQEGEWDSNGQALWILQRYCECANEPPLARWKDAILSGARWIGKKRIRGDDLELHAGLLPAGFSAEHLGLNDFYYWDDYWGVAGLRAAGKLLRAYGENAAADECIHEADSLLHAVRMSAERAMARNGRHALPASPYRRMDAGAIGSLCASYPLQIAPPDDPAVLGSVEFLLEHCAVRGAFFQDMIHSGLNPYLTLHIAQVLLRAGDPRAFELIEVVRDLASATGQWPEAIHPRTLGGCMGDGQHAWAAAELIVAIRNLFVREEHETLVLCGGIPERWLQAGRQLRFGPTMTPFGEITVTVNDGAANPTVSWSARWHDAPPPLVVALPGYAAVRPEANETETGLVRATGAA